MTVVFWWRKMGLHVGSAVKMMLKKKKKQRWRMPNEWSSPSVTFRVDFRNFHVPQPRSPVELLPNRVISTVVSPAADLGPERQRGGDSWHRGCCCAL